MTAPTYTPLPTVPLRTMSASAFVTASHAFLGAFPTLQTEGDALGVFCEAQAAIAEAAAQDLLTTFTDFSGDADSLTSNGVYKLASGVTNGWTGAGDNDFLFNLYYDASNQMQFGYDGAGNRNYARSKVSGSWGSWVKLITDGDGLSAATWEAGTDTTESPVSPAKIKAAVNAVSPFSKEYLSPAQTITSAALLTLAHSLGAVPKIINGYLKCTTAEDNFSIGDELEIDIHTNTLSAARKNAVYFDATNVYVRFSNYATIFSAANKTTGADVALTNSSWDLYVRAWA